MAKLQIGDTVKIRRPKNMGTIVPGSLDDAFEGLKGRIIGEEMKYFRVRLDTPAELSDGTFVTDDLWQRDWLIKQR